MLYDVNRDPPVLHEYPRGKATEIIYEWKDSGDGDIVQCGPTADWSCAVNGGSKWSCNSDWTNRTLMDRNRSMRMNGHVPPPSIKFSGRQAYNKARGAFSTPKVFNVGAMLPTKDQCSPVQGWVQPYGVPLSFLECSARMEGKFRSRSGSRIQPMLRV